MTHKRDLSSVQTCRHSTYKNAAEWLVFDDLEYSVGAIKDAPLSANKSPGSHDNLLEGCYTRIKIHDTSTTTTCTNLRLGGWAEVWELILNVSSWGANQLIDHSVPVITWTDSRWTRESLVPIQLRRMLGPHRDAHCFPVEWKRKVFILSWSSNWPSNKSKDWFTAVQRTDGEFKLC